VLALLSAGSHNCSADPTVSKAAKLDHLAKTRASAKPIGISGKTDLLGCITFGEHKNSVAIELFK